MLQTYWPWRRFLPSSLAEVFGSKRGVYFDGSEPPCRVSCGKRPLLRRSALQTQCFLWKRASRALFFITVAGRGFARGEDGRPKTTALHPTPISMLLIYI